jgi:hypothetical protein
MNLNDSDFIGIYDNVLTQNVCEKITKYFDKTYIDPDDVPEDSKLRTSKGFNETPNGGLTRHDYQIFVNSDEPVFEIINMCVNKCWELYRKKYWVIDAIDMEFEEVKLQKTPPRGGFHDWHCEINDLAVVDRCMVWMLYLNDIPEGEGETEFLWQGLRVQPKAGRMVIWPAFFTHTHRGNAVYSMNKYIATGWGHYYCDNSKVEDYYELDKDSKNYTRRYY